MITLACSFYSAFSGSHLSYITSGATLRDCISTGYRAFENDTRSETVKLNDPDQNWLNSYLEDMPEDGDEIKSYINECDESVSWVYIQDTSRKVEVDGNT